jgi:hypothetical protein
MQNQNTSNTATSGVIVRRGPLSGLFWGLVLVLLGTLSLFDVAGYLSDEAMQVSLLTGVGAIFIVDALVRRARLGVEVGGRFAIGTILILAGILVAFGVSQWWPLILLGAGVAIIVRTLARA